MTEKTCPECGYAQTIIKEKRKQNKTWRCGNCGKINKLRVIALAILMTFAIGIGSVYAIEQTVDVPYKNFQITGCSDVDGIYTCQWMRLTAENSGLIPLTETDETVEEDGQALEIEVKEEIKLTAEERDIQRTIDRIEQDLIDRPDSVPNADKQLLLLLKRAQEECYFGIEQGAPIQQYALFGYPKGNLYIDDTDFSRHLALGNIAKLIEACKGWDKYRFSHLGQQYADINQAGIDATPFVTSAELGENVTNTIEYMQRFISEHDILEEAEIAQDYKCSALGKQRGFCPEGIGTEVYTHDTSSNPVLSKYLQYRASPESAVGEPIYDVKTDAKCAILSGYVKQFELSEESRDVIMQEAGCKI